MEQLTEKDGVVGGGRETKSSKCRDIITERGLCQSKYIIIHAQHVRIYKRGACSFLSLSRSRTHTNTGGG